MAGTAWHTRSYRPKQTGRLRCFCAPASLKGKHANLAFLINCNRRYLCIMLCTGRYAEPQSRPFCISKKTHRYRAAAQVSATPTAVVPSVTGSQGPVTAATPGAGGGNGQVWVNSATHVYHKEGSRFYGKTKHGKYMSEQDAIKEGDYAAKNEH
jgi:hypothetical protein